MASSDSKSRFRFGLRSVFVVTTLVCLLFALLTQPLAEARHRRRVITEMEDLGAKVSHTGYIFRNTSLGRTILSWFNTEYGYEYFYGIDFSGSSITDDDLVLLRQLPYVSHLNLRSTKITDAGLDSIATCSNLYQLILSNTQVTDEGILKLKPLQKLASLQVTWTAVSYEALTQLDDQLPWANFAEQKAITEVEALGAHAPTSPRFIEDPEFPGMNVLQGGETLLGSGGLYLGSNRNLMLTRTEVSHFAYLKSLESIEIHSITIEPGSFVDVPTLPVLVGLKLHHTEITDLDMQHLARQVLLETFTLNYSKRVTDVGVSELAKLRNLKTLYIGACEKVTSSSIDYLRQELPDCNISYSKR